ncbi:MAG TPA: hypothetical protein ENH87_03515 [Pricia antarctica]|uniref:Uncharacterized protein n=1 Tax=Pricia antarctica TaxID=641691 RepID=A0A831VQP5_9FLAO|nr:hypothetical protein [Pricia antarctica]
MAEVRQLGGGYYSYPVEGIDMVFVANVAKVLYHVRGIFMGYAAIKFVYVPKNRRYARCGGGALDHFYYYPTFVA